MIGVHSKKHTAKVLLVGTPSSEKTTLFHQLKANFIKQPCLKMVSAIIGRQVRDGFLRYIKPTVITHFGGFGDLLDTNEMRANVVSSTCWNQLRLAWEHPSTQAMWSQKKLYNVKDESFVYFMNNFDRISSPDYIATYNDYLRCRPSITGVMEMRIQYNNEKIRLADMGDSSEERRKWLRFFNNASAVIFSFDLDEFDFSLDKVLKTNKKNEALNFFADIRQHRGYDKTSFYVIFTNPQILRQRLTQMEVDGVSLDTKFPHLNLGFNYADAFEIIVEDVQDKIRYDAKFQNSISFSVINVLIAETIKENFKAIFDKICPISAM